MPLYLLPVLQNPSIPVLGLSVSCSRLRDLKSKETVRLPKISTLLARIYIWVTYLKYFLPFLQESTHWSEKNAKWIRIAFPFKWSAAPAIPVYAWEDIMQPKMEEIAWPVSWKDIEFSMNIEILCSIDEYCMMVKCIIFWDESPSNLVEFHYHLGRMNCLHLQSWKVWKPCNPQEAGGRRQAAGGALLVAHFLWATCLFSSEYGGNYFLGNLGRLLTGLIGYISQKMTLFVVTAVRTIIQQNIELFIIVFLIYEQEQQQ